MKNFAKAALIALTATGMSVPAFAVPTFSASSSTLGGTGSLDATSPKGTHDCTITSITGALTSSTLITLTDTTMTGTNCSEAEGTFADMLVRPVSTTQVKIDMVDFQAPFGLCTEYDVNLAYSAGGTATASNIPIGWLCNLDDVSVTLSPTVTINP